MSKHVLLNEQPLPSMASNLWQQAPSCLCQQLDTPVLSVFVTLFAGVEKSLAIQSYQLRNGGQNERTC